MAQLLALVVLVAAGVWLWRRYGSGRLGGGLGLPGLRDPRPCATCRHRGKLFDDGVLCRFDDREVFKNETHIRNCIDYERERA